MSEQDEWKAALERAQAAGFRTLPLESKLDGGWWAPLTDNEPPAPVRSFAQRWLEAPDDPWHVLLDSVAAANSEAQLRSKKTSTHCAAYARWSAASSE